MGEPALAPWAQRPIAKPIRTCVMKITECPCPRVVLELNCLTYISHLAQCLAHTRDNKQLVSSWDPPSPAPHISAFL